MTSKRANKSWSDRRTQAKAKRVTQTAVACSVAAASVCLVLVALWLSVVLTWQFPVFSQTVAAWLQAIGVPVAIYVTVWSVRHHTTATELAAAREERDDRIAAEHAREERRLAVLFEAHALLHATMRQVSEGLSAVRSAQGIHEALPAWNLSASRRRQFSEMSMTDAPPSVKSWWSFADDKLSHLNWQFEKLANGLERTQHALAHNIPGIAVRLPGNIQAGFFVTSLLPKTAELAEVVSSLARDIEAEMGRLDHVQRDVNADAAYEPFARWSFMAPLLALKA